MVLWKFLKNEQSYSKNTRNKLPLFFEDLKIFSWIFFSINILAKLWKNLSKIMSATPKSSTYGALHPKPCVALKKLIDHFVPYNPLNKLFVHQNSVGSIFCELLKHFLSRVKCETKIFANFNKNSIFFHVTQKILTPRSYDGQIICSVDCREQNGLSILKDYTWFVVEGNKWNFLVLSV